MKWGKRVVCDRIDGDSLGYFVGVCVAFALAVRVVVALGRAIWGEEVLVQSFYEL